MIVEDQTSESDHRDEDDRDGTITVLCGNLTCKFGVKTYRYAGYSEHQYFAHSAV